MYAAGRTNAELNSATLAAYDGNGNITGYFDTTNATEVATFAYSPFGQTLYATGEAEAHPYRFSTKYTDETGLVDYGHRYYSPTHGEWTARDPFNEGGGLNLYSMIGNDTLNGSDLLGLLPVNAPPTESGVVLGGTTGVNPRIAPFKSKPCKSTDPDPSVSLVNFGVNSWIDNNQSPEVAYSSVSIGSRQDAVMSVTWFYWTCYRTDGTGGGYVPNSYNSVFKYTTNAENSNYMFKVYVLVTYCHYGWERKVLYEFSGMLEFEKGKAEFPDDKNKPESLTIRDAKGGCESE